jgi:hypothetical protein
MLTQVLDATEINEERPDQKAGKRSSTTQRLRFHSRIRGAARHEAKYGDARDSINGDQHRSWYCLPHEFTATLPRVPVHVRLQFLDPLYAGQAFRRAPRAGPGFCRVLETDADR